ncbi:hypothetical protein CC80DRAFT_546494 [Byssothecium circinans]|uniref:Uncharacterized protein n=1 Tax=Byssothecium circinans TaxID=147558 RepID=A0A6A5U2S3_9PLEO|nr:hypothetical protein CC80DRAFT_546494 [Byssothecium circinans]
MNHVFLESDYSTDPSFAYWTRSREDQHPFVALVCVAYGTLQHMHGYEHLLSPAINEHGTKFFILFDYVDLLIFRFEGGRRILVECPRELACSILTQWTGNALRENGVKMTAALDGFMLDDSDISKLPIDWDVEIATLEHILSDSDDKDEGTEPTPIYDNGNRLIVDFPPGNPPQPTSLDAVLQASKAHLIIPMNHALRNNYGDHIKYSFDAIPNACVWYIDLTSSPSGKKKICILAHKDRGTIPHPGLGIPGSLPTSDMSATSDEHECPCMAWFDYDTLLLLTDHHDTFHSRRSEPKKFRGDLWRLLKGACRFGGVLEMGDLKDDLKEEDTEEDAKEVDVEEKAESEEEVQGEVEQESTRGKTISEEDTIKFTGERSVDDGADKSRQNDTENSERDINGNANEEENDVAKQEGGRRRIWQPHDKTNEGPEGFTKRIVKEIKDDLREYAADEIKQRVSQHLRDHAMKYLEEYTKGLIKEHMEEYLKGNIEGYVKGYFRKSKEECGGRSE